jgi:hypothetical protein
LRLTFSTSRDAQRRTLEPAPAVNRGFRERSEVVFHVPGRGPWTLRIDDEPLEERDDVWRWEPGFYAGEVMAELATARGELVARYVLDVAPDDAKLGRARFQSLLDEIIAEDPALVVGMEPATLLTGVEHPVEDPLVALTWFSRLRAHAPEFLRAVREVGHQPRTSMRLARAFEELHRVRRVDVHSARALARTAAAVVLADPSETNVEAGAALRPVSIDVPIRQTTIDCAANRCVLAFMQLVRQRVRSTREWLLSAQFKTDDSETRTSLAARAPYRIELLDRIEAELWRLMRAEPWRRVPRPEITAAGLNALAADPRYARANQLAWKALRTGIAGASAEERVWLGPTWEVFERWCFVRLARLVRERLPDHDWTRTSRPNALACWEGHDERGSIAVLLQPRFPSWDQPARSGLTSVSRERQPDIVLAATRGSARSFVPLDAKYRQSRAAVLDAMQSAHLYRDSLRWHGARADLSLLILPAATDAGWLLEDSFHTSQGVGAFVLGDSLPSALESWLR